VKRRRSSAPGRLRPDGRWSHPILLAALLAVFVAACGQATSTEQPTASTPPSSEGAPTDSATTDPGTDAPTDAPSTSAEPTAPEPTATGPTGSSAAPTDGTGSASSCSGSDENRDFFASMAAAVDWTVYCPSLPDGWFVDDGQYRLANGGWMEISYDGPGEARFVLRQGAFCETGDGCVPAGTETGDAPFGDRTGRFVAGADGSWAIVVDRGAVPSWLLVVQGLDETGARTIAADLQAVSG
jgi:hypothetical protein